MKTSFRTYYTFPFLLAALVACGRSDAPNGASANAPRAASGSGMPAVPSPPVQVFRAPLSQQNWVDEIAAIGTTSANESITLSAKVTETVASINFSDNATVNAGDVLVELTGRAEVAALKEAQAALAAIAAPPVIAMRFTAANLRDVLTRCRVYDYDAHAWMDFDGSVTARPLERGTMRAASLPTGDLLPDQAVPSSPGIFFPAERDLSLPEPTAASSRENV